MIDTIVAPSLHFVLLTKTRETQHTLHLKRTICYRRPRIPTWDQDWTGIPREEPIIEKSFLSAPPFCSCAHRGQTTHTRHQFSAPYSLVVILDTPTPVSPGVNAVARTRFLSFRAATAVSSAPGGRIVRHTPVAKLLHTEALFQGPWERPLQA